MPIIMKFIKTDRDKCERDKMVIYFMIVIRARHKSIKIAKIIQMEKTKTIKIILSMTIFNASCTGLRVTTAGVACFHLRN